MQAGCSIRIARKAVRNLYVNTALKFNDELNSCLFIGTLCFPVDSVPFSVSKNAQPSHSSTQSQTLSITSTEIRSSRNKKQSRAVLIYKPNKNSGTCTNKLLNSKGRSITPPFEALVFYLN